ncbi:MAG: tRNA uridine-5-carboxymethylaminomethyl(34) synthesis GTPase MnmE, partial [Deltaproteobacteria bacterium]|nr:tRNA uridine-5-carboxymethylaminomethyl(34) synthesis GTPase MnmE [Deltaproteobacteria bacterium]
MPRDTIAAIATARQGAGIGIVRLSGEQALCIARKVFFPGRGRAWEPADRRMDWGRVVDPATGGVIDECLAVYMRGPRSYTGEDVVELQVHGGRVVLSRVLEAVLFAGAAMAGPGEFTRRAFENGRMDLSRAEAVIELVNARSRAAAEAAAARGAGEISRQAALLSDKLFQASARVEAALDFPEDVGDPGEELSAFLRKDLAATLASLVKRSRQQESAEEEVAVAIAGLPNVGKSSLLNRLAGEDRAMVSDVPGTTRDVVCAPVFREGIEFVLLDTAGYGKTGGPLEEEGVRRAVSAVGKSRVVLFVTEAGRDLVPEEQELLSLAAGRPVVRCANKADLCPDAEAPPGWVATSALTGQGVDDLARALARAAADAEAGDGLSPYPAANLRQRTAMEETLQ